MFLYLNILEILIVLIFRVLKRTMHIIFSSPGPTKGACELLPSLGIRRLSSVNFSHFKLLLRNHWADWNQT